MHRFTGFQAANGYPSGDPRRLDVAICSCGWKSEPEEESNDSQIKDLRRAFERHQAEAHALEGVRA